MMTSCAAAAVHTPPARACASIAAAATNHVDISFFQFFFAQTALINNASLLFCPRAHAQLVCS